MPPVISPEHRPGPPITTFCTSTVMKSPMRKISVHGMELDMYDEVSPTVLTAPPNTPKVFGGTEGGAMALNALQNSKIRDNIVYMEVMAAKERLDKALLNMKMNIVKELDQVCFPVDSKENNRILEEEQFVPASNTPPPMISNGMSPATFKRRSSLGSFTRKL